MLNPNSIKSDFPLLNQDKDIVYLDSAATTQKPSIVIDGIKNYYTTYNANPNRGGYALSMASTDVYEESRLTIANFINANDSSEIVFTRNATEGINLIANSFGRSSLIKGDEVLICISEHHSNILPWQILAKEIGISLKYFYLNDDGTINIESLKNEINNKTKIIAVSHMSNVLGLINPIKEITTIAKEHHITTVIDGAQSTPHIKVDVQDLDCDFFIFSGHKLLAPMGIGVVYGRKNLLDNMPPYNTGGGMIEYVELYDSTYAPVPNKFEAGTQNVAGAYGLKLAIDYINELGIGNIEDHEISLTKYALEELNKLDYIKIYGSQDLDIKRGVISFNVKDIHSHDVSSILDSSKIAIRSGHHCAKPLMKYLNLNSTCRLSLYLYNTKEDIDKFIGSLSTVRRYLGYGS